MTKKMSRTCHSARFDFGLTKGAGNLILNAIQALLGSYNTTNFLSNEEDTMLEVTSAATEQIAEYFKGKEIVPIRIFLNEGG